ncbi:hypothetical protein M2T36_26135, partial [Escherichia coli]|uniref:hypothetical protein n=1 Tax=Escherichia coli TaxID=562 RepID=UPI00201005FF
RGCGEAGGGEGSKPCRRVIGRRATAAHDSKRVETSRLRIFDNIAEHLTAIGPCLVKLCTVISPCFFFLAPVICAFFFAVRKIPLALLFSSGNIIGLLLVGLLLRGLLVGRRFDN